MTKIDKQAAYTKGAKKRRRAITLPGMPTAWDRGADGPANQHGLRTEDATDIDPETGRETPNPNGVKRRRRAPMILLYAKAGGLERAHIAAAEKLRMAADGMRERDPLAALAVTRARGNHDPEAARVDARRYFREIWANIPAASRPVVERVVLDDLPIWHGNAAMRERHIQRLRDGLDAIC